MSIEEIRQDRATRNLQLHECARETTMGALLRRFWQPVALASEASHKRAKVIRAMSEDLTLYRGESGRAYLVGARCAHRGTMLHPGWLEGETLRCVYHGWRFDGTGQCVERPAEKDTRVPNIRITGYPVHEYAGLLFAYMGEGEAPLFELPRKQVLERTQAEGVVRAKAEKWPNNWFQNVENSLDAAHVSFVHQMGLVGAFGEAVTGAIPDLSYCETDAGIEQVAVRGSDNVRKSDWTFPNNNHIIVPGVTKGDPWTDVVIWNVPQDEEHMTRFIVYTTSATGEVGERFRAFFEKEGAYNPADDHDDLVYRGIFPPYPKLTAAQDYVATSGQGVIADRVNEVLGRSDAGIVLLRNLFFRELDKLRKGEPTKQWKRLSKDIELPIQSAANATA